jgi:hypothetical protein
MEIGYILNELWRRRLWLALGFLLAVAVAVSTVYSIPSFEKKTLELGAASTEILVDAPRSPLGALSGTSNVPNADVQTLVTRAQVYARLVGTPPVKERMARAVGVPSENIATGGPGPGVDSTGGEVSAEERGNQLLAEGNALRLVATSSLDIPVVTLATQGATAEEAIRLADAAAAAIAGYISEIQDRQDISEADRVVIQQLGSAQGGTVNPGVDYTVTALAFVGAFGIWCLLVLLGSRTALSWRGARAAQARERGPVSGPKEDGQSDARRERPEHEEVAA